MYLLGMVVNTCNPSTWEGKARGLQVPGESGLHNETLSKITIIMMKKKSRRRRRRRRRRRLCLIQQSSYDHYC
jgi:hypothetical protein